MQALRRLRTDTALPLPRRARKPTRRPDISLSNPRKWNRPIAKGVLPAYDEALKLISIDSSNLMREADELRGAVRLLAETAADSPPDSERVRELQRKLRTVEVMSEINLPSVRWMCANGMADYSKPSHRHLLEQRWRNEGTLDLLMERIHQMNVVPDVLPSLHPSLDLRIAFPMAQNSSRRPRETKRPRYHDVEPGVFLQPEQTSSPPRLYANVFHDDTRLYTLLMVDPDVPDEENRSYQTYLHWLQPNIPLSAQTSGQILAASPHTPYAPPHPQRGTPYHRYVVLLLPQPSAVEHLSVPDVDDRLGFDVRKFATEHQLDGSSGGGAHMWREVWDAKVSDIYKDVLGIEEPRFGRVPREKFRRW